MTRKYTKHIPPAEKQKREFKARNEPTTTIRIPVRLKKMIIELVAANGGTQKIKQ